LLLLHGKKKPLKLKVYTLQLLLLTSMVSGNCRLFTAHISVAVFARCCDHARSTHVLTNPHHVGKAARVYDENKVGAWNCKMASNHTEEISPLRQSAQLGLVTKTNPIATYLNDQDDGRSSARPRSKYYNRKWSDVQLNLLMDTFLHGATNALLAKNIQVSFDNLKHGDLSRLCSATASLLMNNEDYMNVSATKRISGHQVQERLRCLVQKVVRMQVSSK
jgi:hypothetical protein